jgi:predicted TIM-barrel fold metal-dependent hydrolase
MQSSTLTPPTYKKDGLTIIDVDVHAHDTPAALAPYIEMPWRKTLEYLATVPERYLDVPGYAPTLALTPSFPNSAGDRRQTVATAAQMRQDLDDLGIDIAVIFPDYLLKHPAVKQDDYAVALARAYNRWLVQEWLGQDNGLKGTILAPHHSPEAAAAEIKRYASHPDVVGVFLPTCCVEPLYGHHRYDPVYAAAQEAGLPVMLHSVLAVYPTFPFNLEGFESTFGSHSLAHPLALVANLVSMMETGVPARFPELKIAFTEGGVSWVPWIMLRMDKEYAERRREVPALADRPSHYVRRMFFATQPVEEPEHLGDMATLLTLFGGEDSVCFASDWPHHDFDHPSKVLQIPLSDSVRRKIMSENAVRLLGDKVRLKAPAR